MDHPGGVLALALLLLAALWLTSGTAAAAPADPGSDVIGWENGYWYNESIDVDATDGLNDAERDIVVSRAEARIEVLRDREFNGSVPVSVIDRADYGNQTSGNASDAYREWNNQVWEALFVVGEDEDVLDVLHSTTTAQTTGAYFYGTDEIRIITDSPDSPKIGRGTLVHELVHAQQDEYANLSAPLYAPDTQDEQLATNGLIEGEANYLEARYEARCGGEWECIQSGSSGGSGSRDINLGVYLVLIQPYSDGPPYVDALVQNGGWAAVDAKFRHPPNSSEQIIHHTDEPLAPLSITDNATTGWDPFPDQGENGTDRAGEASIFSMFWYQARTADAQTGVYDLGDPETIGPYDLYDYAADPSDGWGNDAILPYVKQTMAGREYGYVWATTWDTQGDAASFQSSYLAILRAHDARSVGPRTWVIDDGPFADAFRVVRDGRNVTIVNAPTADDLDDVRPGLAAVERTPTPATTPVTTAAPGTSVPPPATETPGSEPTPPVGQPGFGPIVALLAVVLTGVIAWWCRL